MAKRDTNPEGAPSGKDSLLEAIGRCIVAARQRAGLTQAQLAERATLTVSSVFQAENGLQNLTVKSLAKLAEALGVDPGDLFPGRVAEQQPEVDPVHVGQASEALAAELGRAVLMVRRIERIAAMLEAEVSKPPDRRSG